MSAPEPQKVAIITGASQGIGAGLVDGLRRSPADVERVDSTRQVLVLTHADRYVLSMGDFIARTRVVNWVGVLFQDFLAQAPTSQTVPPRLRY